MFAKIFFKEWKDNLVIFSIAIIFMLALIALNLSEQRELTLYFLGMFLLLFLPFSGLLIGSGGFYSEFKDNAWIYIFSRPIRKEKIWIFKFISLLSVLSAIVLIFFVVKQFLPGIKEIMQEFNVPAQVQGVISLSIYLILPFLVFTISFSLSILYEKQFAIFFISVLIGAGLVFILGQYYLFLMRAYLYDGSLNGFPILIGLSFISASILTFIKSDFSQTGKKIFIFSKYIIIFLALSFAVATAWIAKGDLFYGRKIIEPYSFIKNKGDVYLGIFNRGIIRFNSRSDKIEKVGGKIKYIYPSFSIGGDKIAFFVDIENRGRWFNDLWVMNVDGSGKKALIESHKPGSPFYKLKFWAKCLLSPDGNKVAFVTVPYARNLAGNSPSIWWMNTDGTGLSRLGQHFSHVIDFDLFAWPESTNSLIFGVRERSSDYKIIKVELGKDIKQTLIESVIGGSLVKVSPDHNFLALSFHDKLEDKEIFIVLDLRTLERKITHKGEALRRGDIKWSKNGDKVAFSRGNEVLVYSAKEDKITKTIPWFYELGFPFDWLLNDEKFILKTFKDKENFLKVFNKNFSEEKRIKIPESIESPQYLWGLEDKVLIFDSERDRLWRVDLNTQNWKRVY
jgi:hypothetical protein